MLKQTPYRRVESRYDPASTGGRDQEVTPDLHVHTVGPTEVWVGPVAHCTLAHQQYPLEQAGAHSLEDHEPTPTEYMPMACTGVWHPVSSLQSPGLDLFGCELCTSAPQQCKTLALVGGCILQFGGELEERGTRCTHCATSEHLFYLLHAIFFAWGTSHEVLSENV